MTKCWFGGRNCRNGGQRIIITFGRRFDRTHAAGRSVPVRSAGRADSIYRWRVTARERSRQGEFCRPLDGSGTIRLFIKINTVGERLHRQYPEAGPGRYYQRQGTVFRTHTWVDQCRNQKRNSAYLSKALRPLSLKMAQPLKDIDLRYRMRPIWT